MTPADGAAPAPAEHSCVERDSIASALARALEAKRDELIAEICAYPTPIPACDAHFNWLLEMRAAVFEDLDKLARLRAQGTAPGALDALVRESRCLDAAEKRCLRYTDTPV